MESISGIKRREEEKRDRCWDPLQRWRVVQDTITWAERQLTEPRNDPAHQLAAQRKKLARLGG